MPEREEEYNLTRNGLWGRLVTNASIGVPFDGYAYLFPNMPRVLGADGDVHDVLDHLAVLPVVDAAIREDWWYKPFFMITQDDIINQLNRGDIPLFEPSEVGLVHTLDRREIGSYWGGQIVVDNRGQYLDTDGNINEMSGLLIAREEPIEQMRFSPFFWISG